MMKKTLSVLAVALLLPLGLTAQDVEVTGNAGFLSEYHYRGVLQDVSSANAGLDLTAGGFYAGTWGADVGVGNEVDVYVGYGVDYEGLEVSVGGTGYFYTHHEFDETYLEANFGAGYEFVGVEFSYGVYDLEPTEPNYWFLGVTLEHEGLFGTYGRFGGDDEFGLKDGDYGEAGYAFTAADLDFAVSWIWADQTLGTVPGKDDHNLVLGVSKTFSIWSDAGM